MISRLLVLAVLALASACGGKAAGPPAPQPVATVTMRPQPTSLTQEYPAQLEASNTVEIRPQVAGILLRQAALEGTPVKRGQMLFEIDPQPYIAALAQAPGLVCMPPDAGMFMLVDVRGTGLSGYDFMQELYRSHGVSVLDGGAFGKGTAGFIRLCFTTDERSLREGCARIRRFATSLRSEEGA